jgi:hypothetical protein
MDSNGDYTVSDSTVTSKGGIGGDGGFFGAGPTTSGNAGNGGRGGNSFVVVNLNGKYTGRNASLEALGGLKKDRYGFVLRTPCLTK